MKWKRLNTDADKTSKVRPYLLEANEGAIIAIIEPKVLDGLDKWEIKLQGEENLILGLTYPLDMSSAAQKYASMVCRGIVAAVDPETLNDRSNSKFAIEANKTFWDMKVTLNWRPDIAK